jgi:hypothetical protein
MTRKRQGRKEDRERSLETCSRLIGIRSLTLLVVRADDGFGFGNTHLVGCAASGVSASARGSNAPKTNLEVDGSMMTSPLLRICVLLTDTGMEGGGWVDA